MAGRKVTNATGFTVLYKNTILSPRSVHSGRLLKRFSEQDGIPVMIPTTIEFSRWEPFYEGDLVFTARITVGDNEYKLEEFSTEHLGKNVPQVYQDYEDFTWEVQHDGVKGTYENGIITFSNGAKYSLKGNICTTL
jgi:hypothetical protein